MPLPTWNTSTSTSKNKNLAPPSPDNDVHHKSSDKNLIEHRIPITRSQTRKQKEKELEKGQVAKSTGEKFKQAAMKRPVPVRTVVGFRAESGDTSAEWDRVIRKYNVGKAEHKIKDIKRKKIADLREMEKRRRAFINYINWKAPPTAIPCGPKRKKWARKDESSSGSDTRRRHPARQEFFLQGPVSRNVWYDYLYRIFDPVPHGDEEEGGGGQADQGGGQADQQGGAEQQVVAEGDEEEEDRTPPLQGTSRMSRADEEIIQQGNKLEKQADSPKGSVRRTDHGKQVRRSSSIEVQVKPSDQMGYVKGLARYVYFNPEFNLWVRKELDGSETAVDPEKIFESASGGSSADAEQETEEDKEKKKKKKGKTPKFPSLFKKKGGKKDKDSDGGGTTA